MILGLSASRVALMCVFFTVGVIKSIGVVVVGG